MGLSHKDDFLSGFAMSLIQLINMLSVLLARILVFRFHIITVFFLSSGLSSVALQGERTPYLPFRNSLILMKMNDFLTLSGEANPPQSSFPGAPHLFRTLLTSQRVDVRNTLSFFLLLTLYHHYT